jgi:maltooligosyltrehalose trehalohydrolase
LPFEERLGASVAGAGTVAFRVWAPRATSVRLEVAGREHAMSHVGLGVWETEERADHGDDYRFCLDGQPWPDPCSRWQPDGIRGPSRVLDPDALARTGPPAIVDRERLVISEIHIGTFTDEGTFDAAIPHLTALAELGVTAIELMPVNQFPGARGWGYDGVFPAAAQCSYGGPEGLARLVGAAHRLGLAVLLDVVYNHVGADGGDAITAYGPYLDDGRSSPWGSAVNYDGPGSGAVREWALQSAEHWIRDLGVDGLRVDALHAIEDGSARHLCAELTDRVRALHPGALLVAESGLNDPRTLRPTSVGGWGFDCDWADDFHHALHTVVTGESDGWYVDYGSITHLAKAFRDPYVYDGGYMTYRQRRFGAPAPDCAAHQFVVFDQNHDQVGNRPQGDRPPASTRALSLLCTLFSPSTPMLFMGEEYGEDAPFPFFTDHVDEDIGRATQQGRREEFAGVAAWATTAVLDPEDPATFQLARLTRVVDEQVQRVARTMLALRPELPPGRPDAVETVCDHGLVVRRGAHALVANFGDEPLEVAGGTSVVVSSAPVGASGERGLHLPPRTGVVLALPASNDADPLIVRTASP